MRKIKFAVFSCIICATAMFGQNTNQNFADGRIYFKIKTNIPMAMGLHSDPQTVDIEAYTFLRELSEQNEIIKVSRPFFAAKESDALQHTFELQLANAQDVDKVIRQLQSSKMIEYAEKVPLNKTCVIPNDPSYSTQWELAQINASAAWNYSTGGTGIAVAIVDAGVELSHPDLSSNIWINPGEIAGNNKDDDNNGYIDDINGYDVADNDNNPNPPSSTFSHGTMVAGVAAARSNNNKGMTSIGFNIKIIAVKSSNAAGNIAYGYDGVIYAVAAGAKIINCSWGSMAYSATAQNVMNYAYSKGCIIIAAAGNAGNSTPQYPAAYNNVVAVASTGTGDIKPIWTSYGSYVDISAPGENIYTTYVGGTYVYNDGTSFSSPMVAGLCGLMLSLNPTLTNVDLETCIKNNADNIDAINPGYTGKMGAGRINALKTMQCVDATLSLKPIADFTANFTTVTAGGKVIFAEQCIHNTTSWNWTFTGGTPASFIGKTPPSVTYSTPGVFDVILIATNANGSNTRTKVGYINVTAAGGCDVLNIAYASGTNPAWTPQLYGASSTSPSNKDGYVIGLNGLDGDKQKAQYFDASTSPYSKLTRTYLWVYKAYSTNLNKTITINVYDGTSGSPGALLGSTTKTLAQCRKAYLADRDLDIAFRPVINLPASKKFFIGVDYSNLDWTTARDSFGIVCNKNGQTSPSGIWEQKINNSWIQMNTAGTYWNLQASMYMFPFLTNQPVVATSTVNPTTICEGSTVIMNAAGSTFQDTLLWYSPGGSPVISNAVSQSVMYNKSGTYIAKLYVVGGGCHEVDSTTNLITVNATPNISITSSNGTVLCQGNNTTLTASGAAGSYTWIPATNLNTTNGSTVIASPTGDENYTVSGTTAGCIGSSAINIKVDDPITVLVKTTPASATVCSSVPLVFDASGSTNVSSYSWNFPGGTPSTSNLVSQSVTYAAVGTYTATLSVSNNCGTINSYSKTVSVNICTGIDELFSVENINTSYDILYKQLTISIQNNYDQHDDLTVKIIDILGQVVYSGQLPLTGHYASSVINMPACSAGVYTVQLSNQTGMLNRKFVAE